MYYNMYVNARGFRAEIPREVQGLNTEKKKIVVADDNAGILTALQETLEGSYVVYTAQDGEEAVRVVTKIKPDLVILDVSMPLLDGLEACKRIKNDMNTAHIPVIFLTAKSQLEDTQKAYSSGGDSFMAKPFLPEKLLQKVTEMIQKSELKKGLT
jgi:CheY-like chemotaxis protein